MTVTSSWSRRPILTWPRHRDSLQVYHAHVGYAAPTIDTMRVMMMDEVALEPDGWPRMTGGGAPSEVAQDI